MSVSGDSVDCCERRARKERAPTVSQRELCIISQHYVENYEIFHAATAGSSRNPSVQMKRRCLERLSDLLVENGYPRRTTVQLDQRIRDTLRRAKRYVAEHSEAARNGEGAARSSEVPPHIAIVWEKCGVEPYAWGVGEPNGSFDYCETTSNQDQELFEDVRTLLPSGNSEYEDVKPDFTSLVGEKLPEKPTSHNSHISKPFTSHTKEVEEKMDLHELERERMSLQIANERKRAELLEMELQNAQWTQQARKAEFAYWNHRLEKEMSSSE